MAEYQLKDSGVEWLGDIPEHWSVSQVKYLLEFHDNRRIPLSSADRGKMEIKQYDYYGASGVIDSVENYIFDETMILLGEDGANLLTRSKPLAFLAYGKYWVNNHAHILKPKYGSLKFWSYLLEDYDYSLYVTGAAQPKLNSQNLGKLKVTYSKNAKEQKAIANYLDKACQQIDKTLEIKQQQLELLENYRKSIIHEAVTKGLDKNVPMKDSGVEWLGDIPEYWRLRQLKRNYDVLLGKMIQPEQKRKHDKQYPYLRAANIDWEGIKTNSINTMWFQPFEVKKYKLRKYDLLVSEGGDVGKSSLWEEQIENCFYQNAINRVRAKQGNSTILLYYWIYYLKSIGFIDSIVNRITIAHLTAEKLEALPILECSQKEQKAIANYLDTACKKIDAGKSLIEQQIATLKNYRKSLIHECVTGKKRVYFDD